MKKAVLCAILATFFALPVLAQDALTNKSIVDLKKAGLSTPVIKTMIENAEKYNFETSTQAIVALKNSGVDDEIITVMIKKGSVSEEAPLVAELKKYGSGIYYKTPTGIQPLEPNVYSQVKEGSRFGALITRGLVKTKTKMALNGKKANFQVTNQQPVFIFFFSPEEKSLNTAAWSQSATSPNEFILIKFDSDKKTREVISGSEGFYSGSAGGIDDKQRQPFRFRRIESGVYEVYFEKDIKPGEYGFMYAGAGSQVYDFGITKN